MHTKKTLLLLVVVAVLGFVVSRQLGGGLGTVDLRPLPVLDAFDPARVVRLRIENVARDLHLSLERDRAGAWSITDPIEARAFTTYVQELLVTLFQVPGRRVEGVDRRTLGLDPPQATIDVFEEREGGEPVRRRIAIGVLDLDRTNVHVEADGRVLRVPRALADMLDRSVKDYRETRALPDVDADDVVALRRRGSVALEPGSGLRRSPASGAFGASEDPARLDLELSADFVGGEWLCEVPHRSRLEPGIMAFVVAAHTQLRARGFLDGLEADPVANGFGAPEFVVELVLRDARTVVLEFATVPESRGSGVLERTWLCRVGGDDRTHLRLDGETMRGLLQRYDDLAQHTLVRVLRDQIRRVETAYDGGGLVVASDGSRWGVEIDGALRPADAGLVADWLARIDRVEYAALVDPILWPTLLPQARITLHLRDESAIDIDVGPLVQVAGVEARAVRRADEQLWGVLASDLDAVARTRATELLSLRFFGFEEVRVGGVTVRPSAGAPRTFVRDTRTSRWAPSEAPTLEDREFARLADRVIAPVGARWLEAAPEGAPAFEVEVELATGERETYGLFDDGTRTIARWNGLAAELVDRSLFEGLTALCAR
jgi:hypothetical protein